MKIKNIFIIVNIIFSLLAALAMLIAVEHFSPVEVERDLSEYSFTLAFVEDKVVSAEGVGIYEIHIFIDVELDSYIYYTSEGDYLVGEGLIVVFKDDPTQPLYITSITPVLLP